MRFEGVRDNKIVKASAIDRPERKREQLVETPTRNEEKKKGRFTWRKSVVDLPRTERNQAPQPNMLTIQ